MVECVKCRILDAELEGKIIEIDELRKTIREKTPRPKQCDNISRDGWICDLDPNHKDNHKSFGPLGSDGNGRKIKEWD